MIYYYKQLCAKACAAIWKSTSYYVTGRLPYAFLSDWQIIKHTDPFYPFIST